jgi:hypothetical protein
MLQDVHKGLWAATLGVMFRFYSDFTYVWIQAAAQQTGAAQGLPLVSPQEQQLHLLLPAVALQWATSCLHAPSDTSSGTGAAAQELHLMACEAVSGACFSGINRWKIGAFSPATAADSWLQQAIPIEDWAVELLPLLLKFASSSMAQGSRLAELVDTAGQQATGGSSSNSSRRRSCPAVTRRVSEQSIRVHEITGTTVAAMSLLLDILDSTGGADVSDSSSSSNRSSSVSRQPGSQDLQAMLQPHVLQLLQTFEAFTRSTASLAAAETRAGTGGSFCTAAGRRAADSSYSVWACQCILITIVRGPNSPLVASAIAAGLSSHECQQLCSLLLSLLKTSRLVRLSLSAGMQQSVLQTVAAVLQSPAAVLAESAAAPAGTLQPPTPAAAAAATAVSSLLACMLQLFGRACLQLAQLTQVDESGFSQCLPSLKQAAAACQEALMAPALSQQLSVVGCDPQQLLTQLSELLAVLQQDAGAAPLTRLQQQLQATGAAFTSVPSIQMCNNPGCTCVDGSSEQGLVARRSSLCAGCRTARYCGRSCLAAHWKRHKPVCKAIATAAGKAE